MKVFPKELLGKDFINQFKTIRAELIYEIRIMDREELRNKLFEYIECFYNEKRRHSALRNITIDEF